MRCVIVDDNRAFIEVARALLEGDGVEVVGVASTAEDGMACARLLEPDVILVDIELGGESGIELARRLTRDSATLPTRLILMSGHRADEIADLVDDGLASGFLAKTELSKRAIDTLLARL